MTIVLLITLGYILPLIIGIWWLKTTEDKVDSDDVDFAVFPIFNLMFLGINAP
jgi:hypothetical protein